MTSSSNDTDREALAKLIYEQIAFQGGDSEHYEAMRGGIYHAAADRILTEFLPGYTERVKAEAAHDALTAEADAIENYTLMWMPGGGVSLDHILRLLRRDAGIRRES